MLNGYVLGKSKLSRKLFSDKYWMGGQKEYIYQFHTMDIEDGENERQQLLINNDRALYKLVNSAFGRRLNIDGTEELKRIKEKVQKMEKATRILMILQLLGIVMIILRLFLIEMT